MSDRDWTDQAIRKIEADFTRSADTHLERLDLPGLGGIVLYLKDESTHPTGSLKHRLARSLFLYGLCNGWIREGSTVIDASSGSTAIFTITTSISGKGSGWITNTAQVTTATADPSTTNNTASARVR